MKNKVKQYLLFTQKVFKDILNVKEKYNKWYVQNGKTSFCAVPKFRFYEINTEE